MLKATNLRQLGTNPRQLYREAIMQQADIQGPADLYS